jgi:oxalate decarboxylase
MSDSAAEKAEKEILTRREFIGVGSAALAAAGILTASGATGQEPGNSKRDRSKSDPGPKNTTLDAANPDSQWPPATDSKGLVQTFKYSFANKRTHEGRWSHEVTVRELAVSKQLAGVNR